jgi:hypothetical protein
MGLIRAAAKWSIKIGYFAVHGQQDKYKALKDISRVKLKNILINTSNFEDYIWHL